MMEADVTACATDWSSTCTYLGVAVAGTVGPVNQSGTLVADNFSVEQAIEFVAVRSLFTAGIPARNSVVDVDGTKYFVENFIDDTAVLHLFLRRVTDQTATQGEM